MQVLRTLLNGLKAFPDKARVEAAINRPVKGLTPLFKYPIAALHQDLTHALLLRVTAQ
jgi:hypothetical protein